MTATGVTERPPHRQVTTAQPSRALPARGSSVRRTPLEVGRGYLAALLFSPLRVLSHFLPKRPDLWVFGGCRGEDYADNARHFFQWMALHHPGVRCVWVTHDSDVLTKLQERGLDVASTFSWESTKIHMRASVAVTSHGTTRDLHRFVIGGGTTIVRLGSGTPLARTGRDLHAGPFHAGPIRRFASWCRGMLDHLLPSETDRFDLLTVASTHAIPNALSAYGTTRDRIVVTGLARTDLMVQRQLRVRLGPRRVLYIPGGLATSFTHSSFDALANLEPSVADQKLEACDAELFVPLGDGHVPSSDSLRRLSMCERVHLFECGDLHHHLDGFDVFATDGSNTFCDYLLLDRPIIFFRREELDAVADRERWLYYDWDWLCCGPLVRTWDDFFDAIARALEAPEDHDEARIRTRRLFHDHADAENCRRIHSAILEFRGERASESTAE
ncbi:MAG: CDP-glycerol glycerophosphotransferase family protein [Planctomycetes bacterium]|nr:CDP-glycerol glycerophosphotransferase family protein [Planctomycetota bacterium]